MIVSWNWLKKYVALDVSPAELAERLMMAGLNHEGTTAVGDDLAIDLEVTSNRADCLGHLGIAREAAVLFERPLSVPDPQLAAGTRPVAEAAQVRVECPELCPRYTARVVHGVRVAPSPSWLVEHLATVGVAAINNIVDITNFVLLECGQPLHAFDLARLEGPEIVVRRPRPGEQMVAIDHKTYSLEAPMCVIADRRRAVGIGGVMGGAETEVTLSTRDLLIEAAQFDPLSIRNTARRLNLHSDSSYRFERGIDPAGVDWASRRCCQLIVEIAGGEVAQGVLDVGHPPAPRTPTVLRLGQLRRVLGIEVEPARVRAILAALGNTIRRGDADQLELVPPSWRRDVEREIDLVEEVGRIHGYDAIPEDVRVPMAASARSQHDRVLDRLRQVLCATGFDEAMTVSAVDADWSEAFSPWTDQPPLVCQVPVMRRADHLRRSLVPSLLGARRTNEALANPTIELFEIARAYLPRPAGLPEEVQLLTLASGREFSEVKGVVELLAEAANPGLEIEVREAGAAAHMLLDPSRSCELWLGGARWGLLGEVHAAGLKRFELRRRTTVAELQLAPLLEGARLVPQYQPTSAFPAIERDLNLVVDEGVRWADVAREIRQAAGPHLERLAHVQTYRDAVRLGPGQKSLLVRLTLRRADGTLTSEEADAVREAIVSACQRTLGAQLRAT